MSSRGSSRRLYWSAGAVGCWLTSGAKEQISGDDREVIQRLQVTNDGSMISHSTQAQRRADQYSSKTAACQQMPPRIYRPAAAVI